MKRIYAEIGFGNGSFVSSEIEEGGNEYRIPKFIKPQKIDDYYIRLWIFKKMFILSTKDGIKTKTKEKNKLKLLFGVGGEEK